MDKTTLRAYVLADNGDVIRHWLSREVPEEDREEVEGEFDGMLAGLRPRTCDTWQVLKKLSNKSGSKCAGLDELKFDVDGGRLKFRILGYRGPRESDFTMLFIFRKDEGDADYELPCETAQERKLEIEINHGRAQDYDV